MNPGRRNYLDVTRTATYGFLAALPLFLLYEGLVLFVNAGRVSQVRVGADVWIKQLLAAIGGPGMFSLGILVLLIGIGVFAYERRKKIPLIPQYFGLMVGESLIYAVLVALLVSTAVGLLFAAAPAAVEAPGLLAALTAMTAAPPAGAAAELLQATQIDRGTMLVLSIGAGIYEELIFRVVLVGGLFAILKPMFEQKAVSYGVAAVIGALIFSFVHYIGPLGDVFTLPSFTFRFLFGLALNALFLIRGFGIAAWTHALYDVLVVTDLLG